MISIFSWRKPRSVTEAKDRLKSVIKNDRVNTNENVTMEKIRKDVTAVLLRYTKDTQSVKVRVTEKSEDNISLDAVITIKTAI